MITYGIDLGTTYCAVSQMNPARGRDPVAVLFDEGGAFPSLVLLAPGPRGPRAVVGARARREYATLVGRRADPPPGVHLIRGAKNHIGRTAAGQDGGPPWVVGDVEFTATDVSALILRALRKRVEAQGLASMQRVVITHPQKFRNLQRLATQQAAQLAGLEVVAMLTEPDAAACAYEHSRPSPEAQRSLVFDFGGGTLDVVLMVAEREDSGRLCTRVVASEGASCGGLEIDQRICDALMERYGASIGEQVDEEFLRAKARDEFMARSEYVKRTLNSSDAARDPDWRERGQRFPFEDLAGSPDAVLSVDLGQLSDWISTILDRAMDTLHRALRKASWDVSDVHIVRMTGQSSLLVAMQRRLQERFGRARVHLEPDPQSYLHPATIVASGAAIFGESIDIPGGSDLVRGAIPETISFTSRLSPTDAAAEIFEGIPAGTPTPAEIRKVFGLNIAGRTLPDGGRTLPIEVFEGASRTPIGTYPLRFDRPLRHDDDIEISLEFARNGRFSMKARYGEEFREVRVTGVDCLLDQQSLDARRALIEAVELEV
jgi:molecular chaperone DnaK